MPKPPVSRVGLDRRGVGRQDLPALGAHALTAEEESRRARAATGRRCPRGGCGRWPARARRRTAARSRPTGRVCRPRRRNGRDSTPSSEPAASRRSRKRRNSRPVVARVRILDAPRGPPRRRRGGASRGAARAGGARAARPRAGARARRARGSAEVVVARRRASPRGRARAAGSRSRPRSPAPPLALDAGAADDAHDRLQARSRNASGAPPSPRARRIAPR